MNTYTCSICNKTHNNIDDYLKCVTTCTANYKTKKKEEEKARLEAEVKAKREKEEKEIKELISEICEKKQQYYSAVNKLKAKYPNAFISFQLEPLMPFSGAGKRKAGEVTKIPDSFFDAVEKLLH